MSKGNILVVDDNADNRELLARRLLRHGYQPVHADSGEEALRSLAGDSMDAVLLDIRMPGMNGLDCLAEIRKNHGKIALPVLMVTAETDSQSVVKAIQLGANDYVTKPFDFPVILARLEGQLALRIEAREIDAVDEPQVVHSATMLSPGFVLNGRYEIESVLGEGGFSTVYQGKQLSTGQQVAVKVMHIDRVLQHYNVDLEVEIERFEREVKAIARTQHPNIVRLIDSGRIRVVRGGTSAGEEGPDEPPPIVQTMPLRGQTVPNIGAGQAAGPAIQEYQVPYLVLERLEGETLARVIAKTGRFSPERAIELILPIVSAVSAAHSEGVVHRDLTPANIFLAETSQGRLRPCILDFGIAHFTQDEPVADEARAPILGTPDYMSPEQARGSFDLSPATDQYSLAVVIYEMLTGATPSHAESARETLTNVAAGTIVAPRTLAPSLPPELETVLLRAMKLNPAYRFANLDDFGAWLLPFVSQDVAAEWRGIFWRSDVSVPGA